MQCVSGIERRRDNFASTQPSSVLHWSGFITSQGILLFPTWMLEPDQDSQDIASIKTIPWQFLFRTSKPLPSSRSALGSRTLPCPPSHRWCLQRAPLCLPASTDAIPFIWNTLLRSPLASFFHVEILSIGSSTTSLLALGLHENASIFSLPGILLGPFLSLTTVPFIIPLWGFIQSSGVMGRQICKAALGCLCPLELLH